MCSGRSRISQRGMLTPSEVCQPTFTARKRSCGKVMFLHLSVILLTGGGCIQACNGQRVYTPWIDTLWADTPWADILLSKHPLVQSRPPPPGRHVPWQPFPETATEAGGTHPTRMHSCFAIFLLKTGWKWKNLEQDGHPPLDPPLVCSCVWIEFCFHTGTYIETLLFLLTQARSNSETDANISDCKGIFAFMKMHIFCRLLKIDIRFKIRAIFVIEGKQAERRVCKRVRYTKCYPPHPTCWPHNDWAKTSVQEPSRGAQ